MYNIAVVGCGYWGPNLIRNFNSLSDGTVKFACDLDKSRLEHMQSLYPAIHTTSAFDDVVNDKEIYLNSVQLEIVNKMLQKNYGYIQSSQGTGKTLMSIFYALYRNTSNTLVVAPSLAINTGAVLPL